jgi:hypothetical protein
MLVNAVQLADFCPGESIAVLGFRYRYVERLMCELVAVARDMEYEVIERISRTKVKINTTTYYGIPEDDWDRQSRGIHWAEVLSDHYYPPSWA